MPWEVDLHLQASDGDPRVHPGTVAVALVAARRLFNEMDNEEETAVRFHDAPEPRLSDLPS